MIIYVTPFNGTTKETTGPSTDSGFETLEAVVEAMGQPTLSYPALVIYGDDRVVFSKIVFSIDESGSTG